MDYCTPDILSKNTYFEPADVKSPHMSGLGWAAGTGDPKSKRGAGTKKKKKKLMLCKGVFTK